jgi:cytochrome c oxidase subunit 2
LQDANRPLIEELTQLHDFINLVLVFVLTFVGVIMILMVAGKHINQNLLEMQMVEWVWTLIPAALLLQIALPSLLLLYMLDESVDRTLTLKTLGHQWYWRYEYRDFWAMGGDKGLEFDAYMVASRELDKNGFRLLDVDNRAVLPVHTQVRILISSADVLHSWTVPSLGVKADAVPGRLNQVKFIRQRPGLYFGQCSEICGANHRFMPIVVERVNLRTFSNWVAASLD